jgi:5-methylcytosine-specific restriction endonuclease McrA
MPSSALVSEKPCTSCKVVKPASDFSPDSRHRDGLQSSCRECRRIWLAERRRNNPEKVRSLHRDWDNRNRDRVRDTSAAWNAANRERLRAIQKAWRKANPEKVRAIRVRNAEKHAASTKAWIAANPERWYVLKQYHHALRKARKLAAPGSFTIAEWADLLDCFGGKCLACGTDERISVDHVIPLARNGTNDITNLQPLCVPCNQRKGTKTIDYRPSL